MTRLAAWRARREEREVVYHARMLKACRSGDPAAALNAFLRWLDRIHDQGVAPTISGYLERHPDPDLQQELELLEQAVLEGKGGWSGSALASRLKRHGRASRRRKDSAMPGLLPALNPRRRTG